MFIPLLVYPIYNMGIKLKIWKLALNIISSWQMFTKHMAKLKYIYRLHKKKECFTKKLLMQSNIKWKFSSIKVR